ncbi:MAG: hypothetical protein AAF498_03850 [Pseudomonadota bacterium]
MTMNVSKILLFAFVAATVGSSLHAACWDRGLASFAEHVPVVEICEMSVCKESKMYRQCGNVHYFAEEYEVGPEIWLFRIRSNDPETVMDDEYAVEVRPSDPNDIPLEIVDGRPVRLLVGRPIQQTRALQIRCIPVSHPDACEFVDRTLEGLN